MVYILFNIFILLVKHDAPVVQEGCNESLDLSIWKAERNYRVQYNKLKYAQKENFFCVLNRIIYLFAAKEASLSSFRQWLVDSRLLIKCFSCLTKLLYLQATELQRMQAFVKKELQLELVAKTLTDLYLQNLGENRINYNTQKRKENITFPSSFFFYYIGSKLSIKLYF